MADIMRPTPRIEPIYMEPGIMMAWTIGEEGHGVQKLFVVRYVPSAHVVSNAYDS